MSWRNQEKYPPEKSFSSRRGGKAQKKKSKGKKGGVAQPALTADQVEAYTRAIASAKSKFDHQDVFFARKMKGAQEYSALLAAECLADISVDGADGAAMAAHQAHVMAVVKQEFVAFCRAQSR